MQTVLKKLVDERGIRYTYLAEKLALTPSHFWRILNGERPITRRSAERVSTELLIPEWLFFDGAKLLPYDGVSGGLAVSSPGREQVKP